MMMEARVLLRMSALTVFVAGTVSSGKAQVTAESASEFWRNEQRRQAGFYDPYASPGFARGYYGDGSRGFPVWERSPYRLRPFGPDRDYDEPYERRPAVGRIPQIHIDGPQYLNYTPDVLKSIRFDKLCELEVASHTGLDRAPVAGLFTEACAFASSIVLRVLPEVGDAVNHYYAEHPQFLWIDNGTVAAKAHAAMTFFAATDLIGLLPAEYHVALPNNDDADRPSRLQAMMRFELALSTKVLTYVLDATRGRINPNSISEYHDLPRKRVDLVEALRQIARSQDVAAELEKRNPANPQFRALVANLAELRKNAAQPGIVIPDDTFIRPGDSSPELARVLVAIQQTASADLRKRHADKLARHDHPERYHKDWVALVRDFQRENGLEPDGIVGKNTIRAMSRDSTADKIRKVQLAMERLRWLPSEFGDRYLFLNQPAFEATYFDSNRAPLSMRAIIGKEASQTYFFADRIETVEYNPYWSVPRSILINEMLPKLSRDRSYLDRLGYEVLTRSGRRVSSRSIDWGRVASDKRHVSVRQPPGEDNALGNVKIDFPNKHAIYMHDTPNRSLFRKRRRAFSHGCVRLEHPRLMAAAILRKSVDHVDSRSASGSNSTDRVTADTPVYLAYFTAWPDNGGVVRYYEDVYKRDEYLSRAMTKTRQAREAD